MSEPQRNRKRASPAPLIGIWWDDSKILVALTHSATSGCLVEDWYDSEKSHAEEWTWVAHRFEKAQHDDYFLIPRGRVLLNREKTLGRIVHGNATPPPRLKLIAKRFHLARWESVIDDHYLVGPAADALFEDCSGQDD